MGVLDTAILLGEEDSAYGTAGTLVRGYEGKSDDFTADVEQLESVGFRPGMHTLRHDRLVTIANGGTGSLEVDVLNKGMGLLLKGCLGASTAPTQVATTTAYTSTYSTNTDGPATSYTVQTIRPRVEGDDEDPYTHLGTMFTGWTLAQDTGGLLVLTADLDFREVDTAAAAGTPVYPTDAVPFHWAQCDVSLGGTALDYVSGAEVGSELGMRVDRRYLVGSHLKRQPRRNAVPTYSGTLSTDYGDPARFVEYIAGTVAEDLVLTWTGGVIDGAEVFTVQVSIPALVWTEGTPTASLSDTPTQGLPFRVLHNGTDPAVTISVTSTDTDY